MPSVAASSRRPAKSTQHDAAPPAKKVKLQTTSVSLPKRNGLESLLQPPQNRPALSAKLNGASKKRQDRVFEGNADIGGGHAGHADVTMKEAEPEVIEISSAEEESDYSDDEDDEDDGAHQQIKDITPASPKLNGHHKPSPPDEDEDSPEPEELSFGERLQAQEPDLPSHATSRMVDVEAAFADGTTSRDLVSRPQHALAAPAAASLGSVLTQALRTNDQDLVESCLRTTDVDTIYATVERLPSPLVASLLEKLAERLHRRPGRPGMLMVWVQWSLSAHGGYLATQPGLVRQLAALNKVLKERASGLQPLLRLKGRLDMLHTQMELRRRNQTRHAEGEMEEAVIYVEGEEEDSDDDEDAGVVDEGGAVGLLGKRRRDVDVDADVDAGREDDESSMDAMPTTMEHDVLDGDLDSDADSSDEEDEDDEEEDGDLIDDEAEETSDDEGSDASAGEEDELELDVEEDDDVADDGGSGQTTRRSAAPAVGRKRF